MTPFDWLAAAGQKSAAEWQAAFAEWDTHLYARGGEPHTAVFQKGSEVHVVVAPGWRHRALQRGILRQSLTELLRGSDGMLTTRLAHGSPCRRFVERLGFVWTWADETFDFFALTAAPFSRGTPC